MKNIVRIQSVTELHTAAGLDAPKHPLITMIEAQNLRNISEHDSSKYVGVKINSDMYSIMFKDDIEGSVGYGRTTYDFQNGTLDFLSPDQVM